MRHYLRRVLLIPLASALHNASRAAPPATRNPSWLKMSCTLSEEAASSASLDHIRRLKPLLRPQSAA